jgi:cytochrome c-type biogenesis protein CcmH
MTGFAIGAFVLIALTLVFILRPLIREPRSTGVESSAVNTAVLKDQLAELEREYATGALAPQAYEQAKLELKRRLLDDAGVADNHPSATRRMRWAVAAIAVTLPVTAIAIYAVLGSPEVLAPGRHEARIGPAEIEAMIARLAERLEQRPDDVQGWVMLGRSYKVLGRYAEAATAYGRIENAIASDARLLVEYAEVLALAKGSDLQGKPTALVAKALELEPGYTPALMLAGASAFQRGDYARAAHQWEKALAHVAPNSDEAQSLAAYISEARTRADARSADKAATASDPKARVVGTVKLAETLAAKAAPTDTVFVFARAADGPPAPLAVLRRQVKDLPLDFTLDDSLAMAPNLKLSRFSEVVVGARVSRSGNAMPHSGDFQGLSQPVKVGATGVVVIIDTALP